MSGTVSTIIIVVILVVILFFAIKNSIPHFRGEGGCCGGSGKEKLIKPAKVNGDKHLVMRCFFISYQ